MGFITKILGLRRVVTAFPNRIRRFFYHFTYFIPFSSYKLPTYPSNIFEWFLDFLAYFNDLIGVSDILHTIHLFVKQSFRPLTEEEYEQLFIYFGNSIDYSQVWVDPSSRIGLNKLARAYVLFNTINYKQDLDFPTLAHEMMHIWQYQSFGSMYLGRALRAQFKSETYDFGGVQKLYTDMIEGKKLIAYNFEQQGSIIEHLVLIQQEQKKHPILSAVAAYYFDQLHDIQ